MDESEDEDQRARVGSSGREGMEPQFGSWRGLVEWIGASKVSRLLQTVSDPFFGMMGELTMDGMGWRRESSLYYYCIVSHSLHRVTHEQSPSSNEAQLPEWIIFSRINRLFQMIDVLMVHLSAE